MRTNAVNTAEYQQKFNERIDPLNAAAFAFTQPGMTTAVHPLAAALVFDELEKVISWKKLRRPFLRLFGRQYLEAVDARDRIKETLGVELPLEASQISALMNEVQRYKWLEAERAGRDIWRERDPRDPEAGALRDWFRQHFGAWYLYHSTRRAAA